MIAISQKKKPYAKRKAEDYIRKRKLKFAYSKLMRVLQVVTVLLILAGGIWLYRYDGAGKISAYTYNKTTKFFIGMGLKIRSVEIEGNKIVPTDIILEEIYKTLGDVSQKSLVLIDLDELHNNITSIGWIEDAQIKKKLPGTLIIHIIERSPKVIWQSKSKVWLADEFGNLLTQKLEQKYLNLPVILGQDSLKDIPELYKIFSASERLSKMVTGATKIGNRRWNIVLSNNILVKLPEEEPESAWKKLDGLEKKNALFTKRINYIDLRIENQLTTGLEKDKTSDILEGKKEIEDIYEALSNENE